MQLSLVVIVDLGQQSGVYGASSGESLSFRLLNKKGGETKIASGMAQEKKQASEFWHVISGLNLITSKQIYIKRSALKWRESLRQQVLSWFLIEKMFDFEQSLREAREWAVGETPSMQVQN